MFLRRYRKGEMQENAVRLLARTSVKRRPAAGADAPSLFGPVYLCSYLKPFLSFIKKCPCGDSCEQRSCLHSALLTKTQCVSP